MSDFKVKMMFNDYKKGLLIFSLLCILILSLGAISASDNLDDQMGDVDFSIDDDIGIIDEGNVNNEINDNDDDIETDIEDNQEDDENILSEENPSNTLTLNGGTFEDINNTINNANDGDTIELLGTFECTGKGNIKINKTLTFIGSPDTILDAKFYSFCFIIPNHDLGSNCVFKDLRFLNFNSSAIGSYADVTIDNCSFLQDNSGVIVSSSVSVRNAKLTILNSYFGANYSEYSMSLENPNNSKVINCSLGNTLVMKGNITFESCNFSYIDEYIPTLDIYGCGDCSLKDCFFEPIDNHKNKIHFIEHKDVYVFSGNCSIINVTFNDNYLGAFVPIYAYLSNCDIINSSFINNHCCLGIMMNKSNSSIAGCDFINNSGLYMNGGYEYNLNGTCLSILNQSNVSLKECNFIANKAVFGTAVYVDDSSCSINHCIFEDNLARFCGSAISANTGTILNISDSNFTNNSAEGDLLNNPNMIPRLVDSKHFGNSTIYIKGLLDDSSQIFISNCSSLEETEFTIPPELKIVSYIYPYSTFVFNKTGGYLQGYLTVDYDFDRGFGRRYTNFTILFNGETYDVSTDKDAHYRLMIFDAPGNYTATISVAEDEFYAPVLTNIKIVINRVTPKIAAATVTTLYNGGKYLTATLKEDNGNPIKNAKITIKINGKTYAQTTNAKGQVKITTDGLAPKTYTASIVYAGGKYYNKVSKNVKVVVKKANPILAAAAKTFKAGTKTKKYSVTFKKNKNKVFKNIRLTLKVNGKTFAARTNSKGIATFKITNLKKKGSFKATVAFAGSKFYNKITKTAKITVK